jgi:hypothetical protein
MHIASGEATNDHPASAYFNSSAPSYPHTPRLAVGISQSAAGAQQDVAVNQQNSIVAQQPTVNTQLQAPMVHIQQLEQQIQHATQENLALQARFAATQVPEPSCSPVHGAMLTAPPFSELLGNGISICGMNILGITDC